MLLPATASVGRHPGSDLVLKEAVASSQHAELRVVGGQLFVRDLGSRNGTSVDRIPVPAGLQVPARLGQELAFAGAGPFVVLSCDSPPVCLFDPGTGAITLPEDLRLGPRLELDLESDLWWTPDPEAPNGRRVAEDGDWFGSSQLRLYAAAQRHVVATEPATLDVAEAHLVIEADDGLQSFAVTLIEGTRSLRFEFTWVLVLYVLAIDQSAYADGFVPVKRLASRCGHSVNALDVYIARARAALTSSGARNPNQLILVRTGGRKLGGRSVEVRGPHGR